MALPRFAEGLPEYPPRRRRSWRNMIIVSIFAFLVVILFWNSRHSVKEYYDTYSTKDPWPSSHKTQDETTPDHGSAAMPEESSAGYLAELEEEYAGLVYSTTIGSTAGAYTVHMSTVTSSTFSTSTSLASAYSTATFSSRTSSAPTPSGPPIPDNVPIDHSKPRSRMTSEMQETLNWDPPVYASLHMPPYAEFLDGRDYDPNKWENFTTNDEFFEQGFLTPAEQMQSAAETYEPYPDYNSRDWSNKWRGTYVSCEGLQGKRFNESDDEKIKAYMQKPKGFPNAQVGSWDAIGVDGSVCFDRRARLGAFGIGDDLDFGGLKLGEVQNKCFLENKDRYERQDLSDMRPPKSTVQQTPDEYMQTAKIKSYKPVAPGPQYKPRTAVLIRSWEDYEYLDNDIQAIRSLVSELALQSGGEYQVFLFVNIKDEDDSIFMDEEAYQAKMVSIPEELRDMTLFWTEKQMESVYPAVGEYRVNLAQFMPVQWFMETHDEFEYVWNWEMDARLIGHHYHFVEAVNTFALEQPRKYLWERNARFYLPNIHGSYREFFDDTNRQIKESPYVSTIWGPMLIGDVLGPEPSIGEEEDDFVWGVGEEADFISLLPIWDPARPTWGWKEAMWNYPQDSPRRAYINTHARYSRRLLSAMHMENLNGRHMTSELWPSSIALHHGLKAVYAPQPIWMSHHWPDFYLDAVFNAEGWGAGSFYNYSEPADDGINQPLNHPEWGRGVAYNETLARLQLPQEGSGPNREGAMGRWSQERDSPYNLDREHNFMGWSWYYSSDFAKIVYSRWLGWAQSFTGQTIGWRPPNEVDRLWDAGTEEWEEQHGRLCLPSMLLHPVKHVQNPADEDAESNGQQGGGNQDDDGDNWPEFTPNGQLGGPKQKANENDPWPEFNSEGGGQQRAGRPQRMQGHMEMVDDGTPTLEEINPWLDVNGGSQETENAANEEGQSNNNEWNNN